MSANPDLTYEYAETILFVPELHRFSMVWEIFGLIPANSDNTAERYFELLFVETITASMSFCVIFFVWSKRDLVQESKRESIF